MGGFLLDTNVVIRWMLPDYQLRRGISNKVLQILQAAESRKYISAISMAEMAIKSSLGKLIVDLAVLENYLGRSPVTELPFTHHYAVTLAKLPWHHRDPFDRMLIAQAITENFTIITSDEIFQNYDVPVILLN